MAAVVNVQRDAEVSVCVLHRGELFTDVDDDPEFFPHFSR